MINTENLMEIQLSLSSPTYRGPKGDKPVKGVDYFTQEDINDIVSQIEIGEISLEGYASKEYVDEAIENIDIPEVDLSTYASKTYVDNAVEGMVVNETDPTVPAWAKQANKPSYTASEVGALPADTQLFSGNYNDLTNKPTIPTVPANVSAFNNDAGYLTSHQSLTDYATKAYVDDAIADIPAGGITVETDPTVPSWAKQANKPTYTAQEVGALPANTALFSGNYEDLTNKPTLAPTPIVIQATIAGQPTIDSNGNYQIPLAITSNNMAEAYTQYQTHPSTVGIAIDLTAMGMPTKMYMDCESFYRNELGGGGYTYLTFGEFNDSSIPDFGFDFQNINVRLSTHNANDSYGTVIGVTTANQLGSKANSADLATVATSGDYNDLTNKPTIPTAYTLPTATTSTLGGVKVDGSTITIDGNGVISSSASGSSYTFTNGLTERDGTVSWDLYDRIKAGSGQKSVYINGAYGVSGHYSFAEGEYTRADGNCAHAEGQYAYAVGFYQHAEGRANILDSNSIFQNIAGNGTNNNNRSTMFARDWNGNEYLSGNLFVGCNDFTTTSSGLTTANAGGSKVATESYVATAIANIPSDASGISYTYDPKDNPETAQEMTVKDALDNAMNINQYGLDLAELDENQEFEKYTAGYYATNINLQQVDEIDPETGDARSQREMNISASGIDFSNDSGGNTHTLGINDHGELAIDGDRILTTGDNISGGSSYTAGDGINIDSNGVISKKTGAVPLFTLLRLIINGGNSQNQRQADQQARQGYVNDSSTYLGSDSLDAHLANLNAYGMTYIDGCMSNTIANIVSGMGDDATAQFKFMKGDYQTDGRSLGLTSMSAKNASNYNNVGSYVSNQPVLVVFDKTKPYGSYYRWYIIAQPERSFENLPFYSQKGLTSTNMSGAIDELATRIPTAPTTDGNYVLKVSVSSGTPTYSWVAE